MSTLKYWVWLSALTGLRPLKRFALLTAFGDPEKVYFADDRQLYASAVTLSEAERGLVMDKSLDRAEAILEQCAKDGVMILTLQDAAYPQRLRQIADPPVALYIKGRLPAIDEQVAIGVVGTRKATPYGVKMARRLGFELTKGGALVVTGLAEGVDSAAAEGALQAGGAVIGVLGCAIDDVFPKSNTLLYSDTASSGALVSEYPPGDALARKNFPERNRIISGLSVGAVIIEAPQRSGALITASLALEQGREVFVVPGNADAPNCAGSNALIQGGAQLVLKGWDVLSEFTQLFPGKLAEPDARKTEPFYRQECENAAAVHIKAEHAPPATDTETGSGFAKLRVRPEGKRIDNTKKREYIDLNEQLSALTEKQLKIVSVMDEKSMHVDDIIALSGLGAAAVLSELTVMQIKGFVSQESGKRFSLNIKKR